MTDPAQPNPTPEASPSPSPSSSSFTPPKVHGIDVTPTTQCAHWHSERDVIAIKHKCCGRYYACISCHDALAAHPAEVWPRERVHPEPDPPAPLVVLCGRCRREMTADEYLGCGNACPGCGAGFNPGCARHYDLYFEMK